MATPVWQDLDTALDQLLEMPAAERPRKLEDLSTDNPELKAELESILPFLEGPPGPLDGGVAEAAEALFQRLEKELVDDAEQRYRQLGPYRLGERLGAGAMGRVYRGERNDGAFERQVAIKIQRWELADEHLVQRFESERQILARLDHPAIARLLDGGVTDDGVPYLVMELVDGVPIDQHCRQQELSIGQRLELFADVVAAVQLAHGQLVIHRDLKPSNILVTGEGGVKLLDFGVAKLLEPSLDPGLTETGRGPFTYRYASPEQLRGEPLAVASDIYSLGILLYELVAGKPAFEPFDETTPDPRLQGRLPAPPSRHRASEARFAELSKVSARDLDAIVLKAIDPDVTRRYVSAAELAAELQRWTEGRPVIAMPPSRLYLLRKFVQRNALAAGLVALVVCSLVAGVVVSTLQARRAEQQRVKAQDLADFALEILRLGDPEAGGTTTLTARQLLESSASGLDELQDPEVRARVQAVIGEGLLNLQVYDHATETLLGAAALRGHPERMDDDIADMLANAAVASAESGDLETALELIDQVVAYRQAATFTGSHDSTDSATAALAESWHQRAFLLARFTAPTAPERHEVVELLQQAIEVKRRLAPVGSETLAKSIHLLGMQKFALGNLRAGESAEALVTEGLAWMRQATDMRQQLDRVNGTATAIESLSDLALALDTHGDLGQAIESLVAALELADEHLSPGHPTDLTLRSNLASMYRAEGDLERAEKLYLDIVEGWRVADLSPRPEVFYGLAYIRAQQGRLADAEAMVRDSLALIEPTAGSYWIASTLLGDILRRQGRTAEARQILSQCVEQTDAIFGPESRSAKEAQEAFAALDGAR